MAQGGGGIEATFQQSASDSVNRAEYTFAGVPLGAPSPTRRVVVVIHSFNSSVATVTIGGVSATLDIDYSSTNRRITIASAVVPSGTSGDVVVATPGSFFSRCGIGVWTLSGGAPTGQVGTNASSSASVSVATSPGEVVIAGASQSTDGAQVATWIGASERYDEQTGSEAMTQTGADEVANASNTVVAVSWSGSAVATLAAAAYG